MTCLLTQYPARDYARKVAAHKRDANGGLLWVFRCLECDAWHVGTDKQAKAKASGPIYTTFSCRRRARG